MFPNQQGIPPRGFQRTVPSVGNYLNNDATSNTGYSAGTTAASTAPSNALPKDAKIISLLLKNHGIEECEPKVIQMLIEFGYRKRALLAIFTDQLFRTCN